MRNLAKDTHGHTQTFVLAISIKDRDFTVVQLAQTLSFSRF